MIQGFRAISLLLQKISLLYIVELQEKRRRGLCAFCALEGGVAFKTAVNLIILRYILFTFIHTVNLCTHTHTPLCLRLTSVSSVSSLV